MALTPRIAYLCVMAIAAGWLSTGAAAEDALLAEYRWQHRVIIIDEQRLGDDPRGHLQAVQAGIEERHVVWLLLSGDRVESNLTSAALPEASALRSRYFQGHRHAVVLIGKDGGVKDRRDTLDVLALFARIDRMPMRRREMQ